MSDVDGCRGDVLSVVDEVVDVVDDDGGWEKRMEGRKWE